VLTVRAQAWGPLARAMRFNHSVVQSVAKKHGKDEAQIMLRWGLQHVRTATFSSCSAPFTLLAFPKAA
jgi:diketogulonate reductase-like aldo/keto reductase